MNSISVGSKPEATRARKMELPAHGNAGGDDDESAPAQNLSNRTLSGGAPKPVVLPTQNRSTAFTPEEQNEERPTARREREKEEPEEEKEERKEEGEDQNREPAELPSEVGENGEAPAPKKNAKKNASAPLPAEDEGAGEPDTGEIAPPEE